MARDDAGPGRIRLMTALVIVLTFVAGAATGWGLSWWTRPPHGGGPPGGFPPLRELDLTVEQERAARAIVERHREELERILRDTFPRVRAVNDDIEAEVRAILTPEQRRRLDELKARRPPPPPPGLGPPPLPPPPR